MRGTLMRFGAVWHHEIVKTPLVWIPATAVLVHEHLERLVQDGDLGSLLAAEPALLAGLALQVPCGLFAFWLIRSLLRAADELGLALARRSADVMQLPLASRSFSIASSRLRPAALASQHAGRAPPLAAW
jgi:hypothetical protein